MSDTPDKGGDKPRKVPLQVDLYGIKADVTPRPDGDPAPKSWREVGRRVNLCLMEFCTATAALLPVIPKALSAIVRGVARLPGAVARRVGRAHDKADRALAVSSPAEGAVVVAEVVADTPASPAEALAELNAAFDELRAQGLCPDLRRLPSGQWVAVLAPPELHDPAQAAARKAVEGQKLELTEGAPPPAASADDDEQPGTGTSTMFVFGPSLDFTTFEQQYFPVQFDWSGPALTSLEGSDVFSAKVVGKLRAAGYEYVEQVYAAGPANVAAARGIGPKSLVQIRAALARHGLSWPDEPSTE